MFYFELASELLKLIYLDLFSVPRHKGLVLGAFECIRRFETGDLAGQRTPSKLLLLANYQSEGTHFHTVLCNFAHF